MIIRGKGIYAWILRRMEGGNMTQVVERLKWAGMTHIIPKISDGTSGDLNGNGGYLPFLVEFAHKAGIKVLGYQYVYGYRPVEEAERAITELRKLPYDGFVINAERQYRDLPGNATAARTYCERLRQAFPDMLFALSTYRFPSLHRAFPFATFLNYCDVNMPQVYWMKANGTVPHQVARTIDEYKAFPARPIIPTGAAFQEHGWVANAQDQVTFIREVQRHGLTGCNWWEYHHTFQQLPHLGEAIAGEPFGEGPIEPPEPQPPSEDAVYVIEMLGHMHIRRTPGGVETGHYALRGETHHSTEEQGGWYKITRQGVTGWISGNTQWTRITVVEPDPEPEPPEPPLTVEERLTRLERAVFGD